MTILVEVEKEAHDFVSECVRFAPGEVGGIAYVELIEPSYFYISEFVVLEQEACSASVDIEDDAFVGEITRAASESREDQLRCSWHSHGHMSVYYSNTDEGAIRDYKKLGMPWLLSLVYNKDGEIAPRLDIFDSEAIGQIKYENDIEYKVIGGIEPEITDAAREAVKSLVKPAKSAWHITKETAKKNGGVTKDEKRLTPVGFGAMTGWIDHEDDYEWTPANWVDTGEEIPIGLNLEDLEDKETKEFLVQSYGEATVDRWIEEERMYNKK